ncbi:MAG: hypothetical protein GY765_27725 [bacterium]|nr:hypothetical protein [bacterium]
MDIYVNGNKIDYQPMFPLTWGNFFQKLLQNENYIQKDHGIVEIFLDGADSLHVMLDESEQIMPDTIGEIKISTKDSLSITKGGFTKVNHLIGSIKAEIGESADLFREGKIQEASSKIVKIMEAIKPMINFINSVGMSFAMNFDEIQFIPGTSLRTKVEYFIKSLTELVTAQEKKDYVELADYLEYQLSEDMDDWEKVVALLWAEVEALHRKDG